MSAKVYLRILQGGVIASLLVTFFVFGDFLFPYITSKQLSFNILMEVMLAIWLVFIFRYPQYRPAKNYITIGLSVYFLAIFASIAVSVDRNLSFWGDAERMMGLFHLAHFLIFYLILITAFRTWAQWRSLLVSSVAVAVGVSLYGIFWTETYSTIGNTAFVSGYLIFNLFFAGLLFLRTNHSRRWLYLVAIAIMLVEFSLARTSGAIIGLGLSIILFLFLLGFLHQDKKRRRLSLVLALLAVLGVLFVFSQSSSAWFQDSFLKGLTFNKPTFQTRLISWRGALADLPKHWLFGTGFGNYAIIFDRQFDAKFYDYTIVETYFDRAHNNLIDIVSTTGLVGLLSYLSIFGATGYYLVRRFKANGGQSGIGNLEVSLLAALLTAYFIQNLAVFDSYVTYIGLMITLGYVYWSSSPVNTVDDEMVESTDTKRRLVISPNMEMISLIVFLSIALLAAYQFNIKPGRMFKGVIAGYSDIMEGRLTPGITAYQKALTNTPLDRDGRSTLINLLTANPTLLQTVSPEQAEADLQYVINLAEENVNFNPFDSISQLQLAQILDTAARYSYTDLARFNYYSGRALEAMEYAIESSPNRPPVYIVKAQMQLARGEREEAISTLEYAISLNPRYYEGYCRLAQFYLFLETADKENSKNYSAKVGSPLDSCIDLGGVKEIHSSALLAQALAYYAPLGDYNRALVIAERLADINAYDGQAWLHLAKLYQAAGRLEEAQEAAAKAAVLDKETVAQWQDYLDSRE